MSIIRTFVPRIGIGIKPSDKGFRANRFKLSHWNIKTSKGKVYGGRLLGGSLVKAKQMGGTLIPVIRKIRHKVCRP